VILFPYKDSAITTTYNLVLVIKLELDSDQKPRIAELAYANSQEQSLPLDHMDKVKLKTCCRFTRRGVHTLIKIYSASDPNINKDIDIINERIKRIVPSKSTNDNAKDIEVESDVNQTMDTDPLIPDVTLSLVMSQLGYLIRNL
jgi:hypothetical protein